MRYKIGHYAQALADALINTTPETATERVRSFLAILEKHRVARKAEAIGRKAERIMARDLGVRRVSIESAANDTDGLLREVSQAFDGKAWVSERTNADLLAGVRILIDDETLIDASGRGRLSQMFKSVF